MTARSIQVATRAELLSREDFIEYIDSVFAEIRAEALRDAADRAEMEKVDADETGTESDYAYNRGIDDAIMAIKGGLL